MKISTIDINAKEWFDRINGNSYFSAYIILNYGTDDAEAIKLPFQYGYGDYYTQATMQKLNELEYTDKKYLHELKNDGIIVRTNMQRNCRKKDL